MSGLDASVNVLLQAPHLPQHAQHAGSPRRVLGVLH